MRRTVLFVLLLVVSMLAGGCIKPVILTPTGDQQTYDKTLPDDVTFSTQSLGDRPATEMGYVYAQGQSWKEALKLAKEKAAGIGGQAIVNGRGSASSMLTGFILFIPVYETYYFAEGMVVRYETPAPGGAK